MVTAVSAEFVARVDQQLDAHLTEGRSDAHAATESESTGPEAGGTFQISIAVRRSHATHSPD
jgi:hypothetical protein